jgi:hypothetical protein
MKLVPLKESKTSQQTSGQIKKSNINEFEKALHNHIDIKNNYNKKEKPEKQIRSLFQVQEKPIRASVNKLPNAEWEVVWSYLTNFPLNAAHGELSALSESIGKSKNNILQLRRRKIEFLIKDFLKKLPFENLEKICVIHEVNMALYPHTKRGQNAMIKEIATKIADIFFANDEKIKADIAS